MPKLTGKYLVDWVNGLSHQRLFFAFWGAIIFTFVLLIYRQLQKLDQRQFKSGSGAKKGGSETKGNALVVSRPGEAGKLTVNKKGELKKG